MTLIAVRKKPRWFCCGSKCYHCQLCLVDDILLNRNKKSGWWIWLCDLSPTSPRVSHPLLLFTHTWTHLFTRFYTTHTCLHTPSYTLAHFHTLSRFLQDLHKSDLSVGVAGHRLTSFYSSISKSRKRETKAARATAHSGQRKQPLARLLLREATGGNQGGLQSRDLVLGLSCSIGVAMIFANEYVICLD